MNQVIATIAYEFTDDKGEPLHPVLDRHCLAEPFTIAGATAADVDAKIEVNLAALQTDIKEYVSENEDYMGNEGSYGFQGIVHTDTILVALSGAEPTDIHFGKSA